MTLSDPSDFWGPIETVVECPGLDSFATKQIAGLADDLRAGDVLQKTVDHLRQKAAARRGFAEVKDAFQTILSQIQQRVCAGDTEALELIHRIACQSCEALTAGLQQQETPTRAFARKQHGWPMILQPYSEQQNLVREIFRQMRVGSEIDGPLDIQALRDVRANHTPARKWTRALILQVHDVRRAFQPKFLRTQLLAGAHDLKVHVPANWAIQAEDAKKCVRLPGLNSRDSSLEAWLSFSLRVARREAGGEILEHSLLGPYGKGRANDAPRTHRKGDHRASEKRPETWKTVAKDSIKGSIKSALKSFCRKNVK